MPETPRPHPSGPPHNPGVRELVSGKRQWSSPSNREEIRRGFRGWHERGYLPHRDEPGLTQFVTFHLTDSFPATLRSEWETMLEVEDNRERRRQLEGYLDRGRGDCYLRRLEIAKLVEWRSGFAMTFAIMSYAHGFSCPITSMSCSSLAVYPCSGRLRIGKNLLRTRPTNSSSVTGSSGPMTIGTPTCGMLNTN